MNAQEKALRDAELEAEVLTETDYEVISEARSELAVLHAARLARTSDTITMRSIARATSAAGASAAAGVGLVLSFVSLAVHS
jgi:hypothetical protein